MIETIKKHKRIVAVVVILILTAVIELICNFLAIRGGYDDLDLTKYMTVEEEGNQGKVCDQLFFTTEILYKGITFVWHFSKGTLLYHQNERV